MVITFDVWQPNELQQFLDRFTSKLSYKNCYSGETLNATVVSSKDLCYLVWDFLKSLDEENLCLKWNQNKFLFHFDSIYA